MALRQLAGDCKHDDTCPSVWADDQYPEDVIVVGIALASSPVPLGPGEAAVRLRRRTLADASLGV